MEGISLIIGEQTKPPAVHPGDTIQWVVKEGEKSGQTVNEKLVSVHPTEGILFFRRGVLPIGKEVIIFCPGGEGHETNRK